MTVKEVIEYLQKLPQDLPVATFDRNERYSILNPDFDLDGKLYNFIVCRLTGDQENYDNRGLIKTGLKMGDEYVRL